ncbi:MAG: type II secretion system protein [Lacipirellulaceae bacterium]
MLRAFAAELRPPARGLPGRCAGYTLIELMAAVTIVGLVAAIALPHVASITGRAREVIERTAARSIRSSIDRYKLSHDVWPVALDVSDNSVSSDSNPLFGIVLGVGVTSGDWTKVATNRYAGPTGAQFEYNPATGAFEESPGG